MNIYVVIEFVYIKTFSCANLCQIRARSE